MISRGSVSQSVGAAGFEPATSCSQSQFHSFGLTSLEVFALVRLGVGSALVRSGEAVRGPSRRVSMTRR